MARRQGDRDRRDEEAEDREVPGNEPHATQRFGPIDRLDPDRRRHCATLTWKRARYHSRFRRMPLSAPRDSKIAVVGDGFGSLIVYATAVYLGFRPEEITIFGTADNPVKTYQQFAFNLGQTILRSESESHFLPADWPTFAELEAWSRRSVSPLVRSARRRYNPGLPDIMAEAHIVARRLGWNDQRFPATVGWLQRSGASDTPHF